MPVTFSNPRRKAEFTDWPLGGTKRGRCVFEVHHVPRKGFRVSRTTTGKPKFTTYAGLAAIVDGDDGKTYILQKSGYGFVRIIRFDFMDGYAESGRSGPVFDRDDEYAALNELIESVWPR